MICCCAFLINTAKKMQQSPPLHCSKQQVMHEATAALHGLVIPQSSWGLTGKQLLQELGKPSKRKADAQLFLLSSHDCPGEGAGFVHAASRLPLCACHSTNTALEPGPAAGQHTFTTGESARAAQQPFPSCTMLVLASPPWLAQ